MRFLFLLLSIGAGIGANAQNSSSALGTDTPNSSPSTPGAAEVTQADLAKQYPWYDRMSRKPALPAKNILGGPPLVAGSWNFGQGGLRNPFERTRGRDSTKPQDRDVTKAASNDIQPYFLAQAGHVFFSSDATGVTTTNRLSGSGGSYHIWRTDTDGGGALKLTGLSDVPGDERNGDQMWPWLTSNGLQMAFSSRRTASSNFDVFVRNFNLGTRTRITSQSPRAANNIHPSLNPGGTQVVFASNRTTNGRYRLFIANTVGSPNLRQITFDPSAGENYDDLDPAWSPDGAVIAFTRRFESGISHIWYLPNVGSGGTFAQQLTSITIDSVTASEMQPAWTPNRRSDGHYRLLFATNRKSRDADGNLVLHSIATEVSPDLWDIYEMNPSLPESDTNVAISLTMDPGIDPPPPPAPANYPANYNGATYPSAGYPVGSLDEEFAYQSTRPKVENVPGPNDIWISLRNDVIKPLIETVPDIYDVDGNPVREQLPGSTFWFRAKVTDAQTAVRRVFIQFKDPDSASFDAEGLEHRLYTMVTGYAMTPVPLALDVFLELSQEVINPDNYTYQNNPLFLLTGNIQDGDPALRDAIQMFDDGPEELGGHEANWRNGNGDYINVAGDDYYMAVWETPPVQSDFYLDIFTEDNARNQIVYDNITGFTTEAWTGDATVMLVGDYIAGQSFVQLVSAAGDPRLGNTFARPIWQPVESYWTDNPTGTGINGQTVGICEPGGISIAQGVDTLGPNSGYDCDIWRIQSRGAVPRNVLNTYLPRKDPQPNPTAPDTTRLVLVSERAVVWASPYAGNMFSNADSIDNGTVQSSLQAFLEAGGRMLLSGQDINWALTRNGQFPNSFLETYFKVKYDSDASNDLLNQGYGGFRHVLGQDGGISARGPYDGHWPVPRTPPAVGEDFVAQFAGLNIADPAQFRIPQLDLITGNQPSPQTSAYFVPPICGAPVGTPSSAAWNNIWIDTLTTVGTAPAAFTYTNPGQRPAPPIGPGGAASNVAGTYWEEAQREWPYKTVFYGFGLEALHDHFTDVQQTHGFIYQHSRRFELVYNAINWFTTGTVRGNVFNIEQGPPARRVPIPNALVIMVNRNPKDTANFNQITGTALTDSTGNFVITGVPPADQYDIRVIKTGYAQHEERIGPIDGLGTILINLIITKLPPGFLQGKVVDRSGTSVAGATVTATNPTETPVLVQTDFNGEFQMYLPAGQWTVTVDATALGFRPGSIPPQKIADIQPAATLDWIANQSDWFVVLPPPGSLKGKVISTAGGFPNGLPNATVTATLTPDVGPPIVLTAVTDANGVYDFGETLDAGNWTLVVTASGYKTQTRGVVIVSGTNPDQDFDLELEDPGVVRGLVRRAGSLQPIQSPEQLTVQLIQSGAVVCQTTTFATPLTAGSQVYNYEFSLANGGCRVTGNVSIRVLTAGTVYASVPDMVVPTPVPSGGIVYAPPIDLRPPVSTTPGQLLLFSVPYDYVGAGDDPAAVLGSSGSNSFRLFTWLADLKRYAFYPNLPNSNRLVRGRGYYATDSISLSVTRPGTGDQSSPFTIRLYKGWNMIGDPFNFNVRWLTDNQPGTNLGARVVLPGTSTLISMTDAIAHTNTAGQPDLIANSLLVDNGAGPELPDFAYMMQTWKGYWIRCYADALDVVVDPAGIIAGPGRDYNPVTGFTQRDWRLRVIAQTPTMGDAATAFGISPDAKNGFDNRYDLERPRPASTQYIYTSVNRTDLGQYSGDYMFDVRNAGTTSHTWRFKVEVTQANVDVRLTWPGMSQIPQGVNFQIVNMRTRSSVNMRRTGHMTFFAPQAGVYWFEVTASGWPRR